MSDTIISTVVMTSVGRKSFNIWKTNSYLVGRSLHEPFNPILKLHYLNVEIYHCRECAQLLESLIQRYVKEVKL